MSRGKRAARLGAAVLALAAVLFGAAGPSTTSLAAGQLKHQATFVSTDQCLRIYDVTAEFSKPTAERKPVDLVIVQDASGSFQNTINKVKSALRDVVDGLHANDQVQLTTFRGGEGYITANNTVRSLGSGYGPYEVQTRRTLTNDKGQIKSAISNFPVGGLTPTASGLHVALASYENDKDDISNRHTIFVLITDGVANARHQISANNRTYEGYVKLRTNPSTFREQDQEYDVTLQEVESKAQAIKDKGYTLITAYWEDYNFQVGRYGQRYDGPEAEGGYYPIRPKVIQSLKDMASSADAFIVASSKDGENIDDFIAKLTQSIEAQIGVTATFNIEAQYDIVPNSVQVLRGGSPYGAATVKVDGRQITVILPDDAPAGDYAVKYRIRENAPQVGEHLASTGVLRIQDDEQDFPDVRINPTDPACGLTIEKVDENGDPLPGAAFKVVGPGANGPVVFEGEAENGTIVLENLVAGTYYITEIQAPEGYEVLEQIDPVTIDNKNRHVRVQVENRKILGSLTIKKVEKGNPNKGLPGAEFTVEGPNNYRQEGLTTNEHGVIELKDLELGSYTITETRAPEGYDLAVPSSQQVEITAKNRTHTVTFKNEKIVYGVNVGLSGTYECVEGKGQAEITWTATVTNTGNREAQIKVVFGDGHTEYITVAAGDSRQVSTQTTAADQQTVDMTVTAEVLVDGKVEVSDDADASVTVDCPAYGVQVKLTGKAQCIEGEGKADITWTATVTNESSREATIRVVLGVEEREISLGKGASQDVIFAGGTVADGQTVNATVVAQVLVDGKVEVSDDADASVTVNCPAYGVTVQLDGDAQCVEGKGEITWTATVKNTGNRTVDIEVDFGGGVTRVVQNVEPGKTGTATYEQTGLTDGVYTKQVTARVVGQTASATSNEVEVEVDCPVYAVSVALDGKAECVEGEGKAKVTWTATVTNDSNRQATIRVVFGNNQHSQDVTLDAGDSTTVEYTTQVSDGQTPSMTVTATVVGHESVEAVDTKDLPAVDCPVYGVTVELDGSAQCVEGQGKARISWTATVTNTGNRTAEIEVRFSNGETEKVTVVPKASATVQTTTEAGDGVEPDMSVTATVVGHPSATDSADASVQVNCAAYEVQVTLTGAATCEADAGKVTWTAIVKNTGNRKADIRVTFADGHTVTENDVMPGGKRTVTYTQHGVDDGIADMTVTAEVVGQQASDSAAAEVQVDCAIYDAELVVTGVGQCTDVSTGRILWTIRVQNTSNRPADIKVTFEAEDLEPELLTGMNPGDVETFTREQTGLPIGMHTLTATATFILDGGEGLEPTGGMEETQVDKQAFGSPVGGNGAGVAETDGDEAGRTPDEAPGADGGGSEAGSEEAASGDEPAESDDTASQETAPEEGEPEQAEPGVEPEDGGDQEDLGEEAAQEDGDLTAASTAVEEGDGAGAEGLEAGNGGQEEENKPGDDNDAEDGDDGDDNGDDGGKKLVVSAEGSADIPDDCLPPGRTRNPRVDLSVTKVVDDPTPEEGQIVTFLITVTNEGPDRASNVALRDVLPAGLTYVDHVESQGSFDPGTGRWEVGRLNVGDSATLEVRAIVEPGTAGQTIVNTVTIEDSDPRDRNLSNNTATAEVTPPEPILIEEEPPLAEPPADPPLPVTGGSMALLLIPGITLLGAGLYVRRRYLR